MEFAVVRINWEQILAIVPIINDGNIYWTQKTNFWGTFSSLYTKIFSSDKGSDPFDPVATKYYELEDETICTEQTTIAALQCIKNQLSIRSGCVYTDQSLWEIVEHFSGPRKVRKTQWKNTFIILHRNISEKKAPTRFAILRNNITN